MLKYLRLLRRRKRREKSDGESNFEYCEYYEIIGGRNLTIHSDRYIDSEKAEEIKRCIEKNIHIIEDPDETLSGVVAEIVYTILDNKAITSLWAVKDNEYDMYIMYNL